MILDIMQITELSYIKINCHKTATTVFHKLRNIYDMEIFINHASIKDLYLVYIKNTYLQLNSEKNNLMKTGELQKKINE